MREYLGPKPACDYGTERHNAAWADHVLRTYATAGVIAWLQPVSVTDPACGDASIVMLARRLFDIQHIVLADISHANVAFVRSNWAMPCIEAPIGEGIDLGPDSHGSVVVLTEILEHLEDPEMILNRAAMRYDKLVVSSPLMRDGQVDTNPEHLWMFDREGYEEMLEAAGWTPFQFTKLEFETEYDFGIWACR